MKHWRIILWPAVATLIALGILLSLGTWQLLRMNEKAAQLNALNSAITAQPLNLQSLELSKIKILSPGTKSDAPTSIAELTRVAIVGTYISGRSVPVRSTMPTPKNNRSVGGLGFFWMTPLQVENGPIIFINRGFVPVGTHYKAPAIETPEGLQTISGLIRRTEKPQTFTPADNPAKGEYFARDPQRMAGYVSLREAVDFFIDAERLDANTLTPPIGVDLREMISRIPNNHLQYAVTWFGFAITLLFVFGFFAYGRIKAATEMTEKSAHV